jgi:hemerythrin
MEQIVSGRRRLSTGEAQLDAGYRAVQAALAYTEGTRDDNLGPAFTELVDTLEHQFRDEEALMESIDFPALHSHREQHMRVLTALRLAESALVPEPWLARHALGLLSNWLELHVQTQDTVLALALELADTPPGKTS